MPVTNCIGRMPVARLCQRRGHRRDSHESHPAAMSAEGEGEDEEFVELDLEKTLTWTGQAVTIQAGGEFRLPLIVPHPSVLAIQFEVEGGYDIEFSLNFQDDHEEGSSVVRHRRPAYTRARVLHRCPAKPPCMLFSLPH